MSKEKVVLTMSSKQLDEIINALDFYFRFHLWQPQNTDLSNLVSENLSHEEFDDWCLKTKKLLFNLGYWESFSYTHKPEIYEIVRELQHQRSLHNKYDDVYSTPTLKCTNEDLIDVKFIRSNV